MGIYARPPLYVCQQRCEERGGRPQCPLYPSILCVGYIEGRTHQHRQIGRTVPPSFRSAIRDEKFDPSSTAAQARSSLSCSVSGTKHLGSHGICHTVYLLGVRPIGNRSFNIGYHAAALSGPAQLGDRIGLTVTGFQELRVLLTSVTTGPTLLHYLMCACYPLVAPRQLIMKESCHGARFRMNRPNSDEIIYLNDSCRVAWCVRVFVESSMFQTKRYPRVSMRLFDVGKVGTNDPSLHTSSPRAAHVAHGLMDIGSMTPLSRV